MDIILYIHTISLFYYISNKYCINVKVEFCRYFEFYLSLIFLSVIKWIFLSTVQYNIDETYLQLGINMDEYRRRLYKSFAQGASRLLMIPNWVFLLLQHPITDFPLLTDIFVTSEFSVEKRLNIQSENTLNINCFTATKEK